MLCIPQFMWMHSNNTLLLDMYHSQFQDSPFPEIMSDDRYILVLIQAEYFQDLILDMTELEIFLVRYRDIEKKRIRFHSRDSENKKDHFYNHHP